MTAIRPARESAIAGMVARLAEPVNRNRPGSGSSSTLALIASIRSGALCTSSITARLIPRMNPVGSVFAAFKVPASSSVMNDRSLSETMRASVVLPDCRGPEIKTTRVSARAASMRGNTFRETRDFEFRGSAMRPLLTQSPSNLKHRVVHFKVRKHPNLKTQDNAPPFSGLTQAWMASSNNGGELFARWTISEFSYQPAGKCGHTSITTPPGGLQGAVMNAFAWCRYAKDRQRDCNDACRPGRKFQPLGVGGGVAARNWPPASSLEPSRACSRRFQFRGVTPVSRVKKREK